MKKASDENDRNGAWVPFYQTLLWIGFIGILLLFFGDRIGAVADALVDRTLAGAAVEFGSVKFGAAPPGIRRGSVRTAVSEGTEGVKTSEQVRQLLVDKNYPTGVVDDVYLVHESRVITARTARTPGRYQIRLWLEAYEENVLNEITRVTYRLYDDFPEKVISTEDRASEFELWLNVYGEFTVVAYAERANAPPLWLTRYLDLPGRPPE